MSLIPSRKQVLNLTGSAITPAYAASAPLYVGGVARLRLYLHVVTAPASPLTTITVKVQQRYSQREPQPVQLGWVDTASTDAAGASSVEHAFTVAAGGTFDFALVLDPLGISDEQVLVSERAGRSRRLVDSVPVRVHLTTRLLQVNMSSIVTGVYFPDLSPYGYFHGDDSALNVGWLDEEHDFSKGSVPEDFLQRLLVLCVSRGVNATRGWHRSPFGIPAECCDPKYPGGYFVSYDGQRYFLGTAEIRVTGPDGRRYAAPNLIYHYVRDCGYLPPDDFVKAVLSTP